MYLCEVKIKNFRGYGENPNHSEGYYIFNELNNSLVVFHGFNGHGKTSFFEAIEWCLTDTVARLEKLYKAEHGGAYTANDLNRSHYLKFSPSVTTRSKRPIQDRKVVVELTFDNGVKVIRTSNSRVLPISESSDYTSSLSFIENGNEAIDINNDYLLEYFAPKSNDRKSFIRAHMLAQEGITDFVRRTSPDERKSLFMRYLQQEGLSDHLLRLRNHMKGGNLLSRKKTEYENKKNESLKQQQQINVFLQNIGFVNFESYKHQFRLLFEKLIPFLKRETQFLKVSINLLAVEGELKAENYTKLLQSAAQVHAKAVIEKERLRDRYAELKRIRKYVESLELLTKSEEWIRKGNHARLLKDADIEGLQKVSNDVGHQKQLIDKSKKNLTEQLTEMVGFEFIFSSISNRIDLANKNISKDVWDSIEEEFERAQDFAETFNEIFETKHLSLPLKDEKKLMAWKTKFSSLDVERQQVANIITSTTEKKISLSSLNSDYKQILDQVRTYIHNHTDNIKSCPICLNKDFTSERYGAHSGTNIEVPTSLIAIIDKTVSNGDEALEKLSEEETQLNIKMVELISTIETDVIKPLTVWLHSLREQFLSCYREVKNNIEQQQKEQAILEAKLNQKGREVEFLWERLRESTRILFGDGIELRHIDVNSLDALLTEKDNWFVRNMQLIGFEYEPSIDEITNKILRIRNEKEVADYYPSNLVQLDKNHLSNKRTQLMIELLIMRLEDLLKLKVPSEYNEFFSRYEMLDAELREYDENMKLIDNYQQQVKYKHSELVARQNKILGDQLHGHPVIAWVYGIINPHTQYKDLKVIVDNQGTHFTSKEIQNNLYLDQIFSQAQLNILALSTFIGIGLTQRYSTLEQLFIDDPIQSMDDVNVLAFIDVLRAVLSSGSNKKRLIISTHDDNFAELLTVKMRNQNVTKYYIEGYGPEGPIVRKHE